MVIILNKQQIDAILAHITTEEVVDYMERAFIGYSNDQAVVPPVGELIFTDPKGEAHIKYGYIKGGDSYCIKIASGFYDNPKLGIASSQGMMLLFNQQTGQPQAVLLDEGWLTDIRTAAAGALAAKYFAPKQVSAIGIVGTGTQAKLQLRFLKAMTPCRTVWVWGRSQENAQKYRAELAGEFDVQIAENPSEVARNCNLIVTTTPSEIPLLQAKDIQAGTHITAMGSDTAHKQELESNLLKKADLVVSDSIPQSKSRGEVYRAVKDGAITSDKVVELGNAIQDASLQRTNDHQISVVDLTGVAVQDIMIANAVYTTFRASENQSS